MNEKEDQHRQELTNVTSQLDQVTFELSQLRKSSAESEEKSRAIIAKLEREMSCMREGQQQLSDVSHELAQLRQTHAEYKTKMEAKVNTLNATISSHLPFIDSSKLIIVVSTVSILFLYQGSLTMKDYHLHYHKIIQAYL